MNDGDKMTGGGRGYGGGSSRQGQKLSEEKIKQIDQIQQQENRKIEDYINQAKIQNRERILQKLIKDKHGLLGIVYLDVGQGDCSVIKFPNGEVMVVDCNVDDANIHIVDFLKRAGVEKIDYLVITHPHYDHTSGIKDIADNYKVKELWTSSYERRRSEESPESWEKYREYCKVVGKLKSEGTEIVYPKAKSDEFRKIGEIEIYCYGPSSSHEDVRDIHARSMILKLKYDKFSALFSGDINKEGWERVTKHYDIKSDVATASHHGSETGYDDNAQEAISPKYTIISTGNKRLEEKTINHYKSKSKVYKTSDGSVGLLCGKEGECKIIEG